MRAINDPVLTAATKQSVTVDGLILLPVRLVDLRVNARFGFSTRLTAPLPLGTSFLESFVRGIYTQGRKLVPFHCDPVAIDDKLQDTKYTTVYKVEDYVTVEEKEELWNPFRVEKCIHIEAKPEALVIDKTTGDGLYLIETHPNLYKRRMELAEAGISDSVWGTRF